MKAVIGAFIAFLAYAKGQAPFDCSYPDSTVTIEDLTDEPVPPPSYPHYATAIDGHVEGGYVPGTFDFYDDLSCSEGQPTTAPHPTTPNPTFAPSITAFPSASPTALGCVGAYVYCNAQRNPGAGFYEGSSSDGSATPVNPTICFSPMYTSGGDDWGFSIDTVALGISNGGSVHCPIYKRPAGSDTCHIVPGVQVGYATITRDFVSYEFNEGLGAVSFALYSGDCPVNDAGMSSSSGGACAQSDMSQHAANVTSYTLTTGSLQEDFSSYVLLSGGNADHFMDLSTGAWPLGEYSAFPLGTTGHQYISAYAEVCPCPDGICSTPSPFITPVSTPVAQPSVSPVKQPTVSPVVGSQSPTVPAAPLGCVEAYAYCNGQVIVAASQSSQSYVGQDPTICFTPDYTAGGNDWGFSIDTELLGIEEGGSYVCPIYEKPFGADICDVMNSIQVGYVTISKSFVSYQFNEGYGARYFSLYAGDCPVNDAAMSPPSTCSQVEMSKYAANTSSYSLTTGTLPADYSSYVLLSGGNEGSFVDLSTGDWDPNTYKAFPLGLDGHKYISAYAQVCPCPDGICSTPAPFPQPVETATPTTSEAPSSGPTVLPVSSGDAVASGIP